MRSFQNEVRNLAAYPRKGQRAAVLREIGMGVGSERRLSCSLSSFDGTGRDCFEAGNDFFAPHHFCPARIGQVMQLVLVTHLLGTNGAYITDVQRFCQNANSLIEQNFSLERGFILNSWLTAQRTSPMSCTGHYVVGNISGWQSLRVS
jgi:hypothetical protein